LSLIYIINNFAQQFFSKQLFETDEGQAIGLSYLKERGFREEVLKKFQVGYSPQERTAFTSEALKQQYNPELLDKDRILAVSNSDMLDEELKAEIAKELPTDLPSLFISSVAQEGLTELKDLIWKKLNP